MESNTNDTPKEKLGKLVLNLGGLPALILGGFMSIGGLLLFLYGLFNYESGSLNIGEGLGAFLGLFILVLGVVMLGLWYPSRLGLRSPAWTIFGISINLFAGIAGIIFLIIGLNEYNIGLGIPVAIVATIAILNGMSSLLGWWLRGLFN